MPTAVPSRARQPLCALIACLACMVCLEEGHAAMKPQVIDTRFPTDDIVIASLVVEAPSDGDATGAIQAAIEADADNRVADLHVWRVGPRHLAAIVSVVSHAPCAPEHYKELLRDHEDLVHLTVEVHGCAGEPCVFLAS